MTEDEREARKAAAHQIIKEWLEFSTLRYYTLDLRALGVEKGSGDVIVRLVLKVSHWEVEKKLWESLEKKGSKP